MKDLEEDFHDDYSSYDEILDFEPSNEEEYVRKPRFEDEDTFYRSLEEY